METNRTSCIYNQKQSFVLVLNQLIEKIQFLIYMLYILMGKVHFFNVIQIIISPNLELTFGGELSRVPTNERMEENKIKYLLREVQTPKVGVCLGRGGADSRQGWGVDSQRGGGGGGFICGTHHWYLTYDVGVIMKQLFQV